jgi:hypothetical protein
MPGTHQNSQIKRPGVLSPTSRGKDAVFLGWQERNSGEPFALYTVTVKGHPYFGSTLTYESLHKLGLEIPKTRGPRPRPKSL